MIQYVFLSPSTVPEDFDYNPHSGKHGDRSHRVELKRSSVEYIAPSEYMVSSFGDLYLYLCGNLRIGNDRQTYKRFSLLCRFAHLSLVSFISSLMSLSMQFKLVRSKNAYHLIMYLNIIHDIVCYALQV